MHQIAHQVQRQVISAQVHHSDVSGQSGSIASTARSTGFEPQPFVNMKVERILCPSRTAMMKTHGNSELYQLHQAPPSQRFEDHVLHEARVDPEAIHRAAQRHTVHGEFPRTSTRTYSTQHMTHDARDCWRNQKVTVLCINRRYNSKMLSKNINGVG